MTEFEREVIDRLARIEEKLKGYEAAKSRAWTVWLVVIPLAVSSAVSLVVAYAG